MTFLLAAIPLGFLGSFHCIGMCGPIALALPVHHKTPLLRYFLILVYNGARVIGYSLLGLVAGLLGQGLSLAGFQQGLSIALGLLLLLAAWLPLEKKLSGSFVFSKIKSKFFGLFERGSAASLFTIGILNGFLPCGLVYVGLAGAAATGDLIRGALFMGAFGLGTVPMMFILPLAGGIVSLNFRNRLRKASPVIVTAMAAFLILRGLNLGIPYLSPEINKDKQTVTCHAPGASDKHLIKCGKSAK